MFLEYGVKTININMTEKLTSRLLKAFKIICGKEVDPLKLGEAQAEAKRYARIMLRYYEPLDKISKKTGLSIKVIKTLKYKKLGE